MDDHAPESRLGRPNSALSNAAEVAGLGLAVSLLVPHLRWTDLLFGLFLVTVVHVFVFTAAFLLHGSIKTGRLSGFVSCTIHLLCAALLLLYRPASTTYSVAQYTVDAASPFFPLIAEIQALVGADGRDGLVAVARFLAFAYTYHYLNWFSKTRIIGWHEVSRRRLAVIAGLYALSLGLYAYDYRIGLSRSWV